MRPVISFILIAMILMTQSAYMGHGHATDATGDPEFQPHLHLGSASHHHHSSHGHDHAHRQPKSTTNCDEPSWRMTSNHADNAIYVAANIVLRPCDAPVVAQIAVALEFIAIEDFTAVSTEQATWPVLSKPPPLRQHCPLYTQLCTWLI